MTKCMSFGRTDMRELTQDEKLEAFKRATGGFNGHAERWMKHAQTGLTDEELAAVLKHELGIFGGSGGPDTTSISFQGAGLKIWASWETHKYVQDKPIFQGRQTIEMARSVYGICDPQDMQMCLFD